MAVALHLRAADIRSGGGHTAAADLLFLIASTQQWFVAEKGYSSHESAPVQLNHADLFLDRTVSTKRHAHVKAEPPISHATTIDLDSDAEPQYEADSAEEADGVRRNAARHADRRQMVPMTLQQQSTSQQAPPRKKYSQYFIWGQLNGWFKQTVYDPAATLSAERRGTLSLPDVESAYGMSAVARYDAKVCCDNQYPLATDSGAQCHSDRAIRYCTSSYVWHFIGARGAGESNGNTA